MCVLFISRYTFNNNKTFFFLSIIVKTSFFNREEGIIIYQLQNLPLSLFNFFFARVMYNYTIWKYSKYTNKKVCLYQKKSTTAIIIQILPISDSFVTLRAHTIFCNFDSSRPIKKQLFFNLTLLY